MATPPPLPPSEEIIVTNERFRLLALGYYVSAGVGAFFASFILIYAVVFGALSFIPEQKFSQQQQQTTQDDVTQPRKAPREVQEPPVLVFRILAASFVIATIAGWTLAGLTAYAGYCLHKRKHRLFTNIMAAYNTLWIPYGTLLGVLTLIHINSAPAIRIYEARKCQTGDSK